MASGLEPLHLLEERRALQVEQVGSQALVAVGAPECLPDQFALDVVHVAFEVEAIVGERDADAQPRSTAAWISGGRSAASICVRP